MMNTMYKVAILAGGLATRLRPMTETIPKAMITVQGEPFIAHQLRLLKRNHINEVVLCLGFLGEQVKDYVNDGTRFGLSVSYVDDGPILLGTAGAIKQALPQLGDHFFILYGDSYLPCEFSAVQAAYIQHQQRALMTVFKNQGLWDTSNVEYTQGNLIAYDKQNRTDRMHYIDYGLGIFSKEAFENVASATYYDLADLYQALLHQQQLAAFEVTERFYEVGSFQGITELNDYLICEDRLCNLSTSS